MFDEEGFAEFARAIAQANSIPLELASEYAALIGDTPELVEAGSDLVVVRDETGREIARVIMPFDCGGQPSSASHCSDVSL